jgi:multidrug efflux pump subunit AcrB
LPLIIAYRDGIPVRLSNLADVTDSVQTCATTVRQRQSRRVRDHQPQPGANIIATVDRIKRLLPQLRASIPSAIDVRPRWTARRRSALRCARSRRRS